ncbi:MAG: formate dehydrogenase accessory sulfurtransferase FdhD [Fuscovulum sp.]|nr:MAG: formate dehydrogenase accessory sulfurtransferase FdhD [Fuscovulum sp.]
MMDTARRLPRLSFGSGGIEQGSRPLPEEVAVALSFNGSTQAVMMATPDDLVDFAYGFALTEGIATPDQIESVEVQPAGQGIDVQVWLTGDAEARLAARRRTMAGPVGCGLCGIDSIEQAMRPVVQIAPSAFRMTPAQVMQAVAALTGRQPLHDVTRAAHCAAFWTDDALVAAREDVGRHNALDKLTGHLIRAGHAQGAVVLTSRVSIDMVQKVCALGAPVLIAVSAPTAHAVDLAEEAGLTLIALARPDRFEVFTHSDRLMEIAHVR